MYHPVYVCKFYMGYLCHWDPLDRCEIISLKMDPEGERANILSSYWNVHWKFSGKVFQFSWIATVSIHKTFIHEITISQNMHNCNLVRQRWTLRHSSVSKPFIAAIFWSCLWLLSTFLHKGSFMLQTRQYENVRCKFRLFGDCDINFVGGY